MVSYLFSFSKLLFYKLYAMIQFTHPSTFIISGPSQCGKTFFTYNILKNKMIYPFPDRIIWNYSMAQPLYNEIKEEIPNIEFIKGYDQNILERFSPCINNLLILDDLMQESGNSELLSQIFTRGSHHLSLSVIYIVQNIFHKGGHHRECSLNSQYVVLFNNPRDRIQVRTLSSQMYPNTKNFLADCLGNASELQDRGYLLLDLRSDTPEDFRIRSLIFPGEETVVYKDSRSVRKSKLFH